MIEDILVDDITSRDNRRDVIIAMNAQFKDVRGIGLPFVNRITLTHPIDLGSVLSFRFDEGRNLHMLICHELGNGGWRKADQYVRYGLDFLWQQDGNAAKQYSIVSIGTGRVGLRDGADHRAIRTAIANSFLPVYLFVLPKEKIGQPMEAFLAAPNIVPFRAWSPERGVEEIRAAA